MHLYFLIQSLFTSTFHHHVSPLLYPLIFIAHTSSHAIKPHSKKICTNLYENNTELTFCFFKSHPELFISQQTYLSLSPCVFLTTFIIFIVSVSATTSTCQKLTGISFTFHKKCRCSFLTDTKSISVSHAPF